MSRRQSVSPVLHDRPTRSRPIAVLACLALLLLVVALAQPGTASSQPAAPSPPAEPHIREFARELSGQVRQPLPTPERFVLGASFDGCDHAYGVHGECVPVNFPPGIANTPAAKCAWLQAHGFGALEVPGRDSQGLVPQGGPRAPSGNVYACPQELRPR